MDFDDFDILLIILLIPAIVIVFTAA